MPIPFVIEEAKKYHQTKSQAESAWEKAKQISANEKSTGKGHWGLVTDIFKNIEKSKK